MLHTTIQGYWPYGYREDLNGFTIHEHGDHQGHVTWTICITFPEYPPLNLLGTKVALDEV